LQETCKLKSTANSSFIGDSVVRIVNIVLENVVLTCGSTWRIKLVFCSTRQTAVPYLTITL